MKIINNTELSVSQNFLTDKDFVRSLLKKTNINQDDTVIDIGAGIGIITDIVSESVKQVIAIEYDNKLSDELFLKFKENKKVKIVKGNFLNYDLPKSPYKVFANPPFNLSSDILNKLLKFPSNMEVAYLILQKETVERYKDSRNQIANLIAPFYDISIIDLINKNEFRPSPKVDIVFSKFEKLKKPLIEDSNIQLYRDFVIYSYNQWKPNLLEAFNKVFTKEQAKIISKKYNLVNKKPSELIITEWLGLFDTFVRYVSDEKKRNVIGYELKHSRKHKDIIKRNRTNI